eukprot:2477022-Pleurochrysis_carterae.AAC.5
MEKKQQQPAVAGALLAKTRSYVLHSAHAVSNCTHDALKKTNSKQAVADRSLGIIVTAPG